MKVFYWNVSILLIKAQIKSDFNHTKHKHSLTRASIPNVKGKASLFERRKVNSNVTMIKLRFQLFTSSRKAKRENSRLLFHFLSSLFRVTAWGKLQAEVCLVYMLSFPRAKYLHVTKRCKKSLKLLLLLLIQSSILHIFRIPLSTENYYDLIFKARKQHPDPRWLDADFKSTACTTLLIRSSGRWWWEDEKSYHRDKLVKERS